jgi:sulfane dehydrogenase subunit SoxC
MSSKGIPMDSKQSDRRRFLKGSAVLAGLAVGAIRSASGQEQETHQTSGSETPYVRPKKLPMYGERSHFETSLGMDDPSEAFTRTRVTPLQDSKGIITPSALHYVNDHGYDPADSPDIDPREHRLLIHGMVDRPLIFTMEELKRFPSVSRIHFIECNGNSNSRHFFSKDAKTAQYVHGRTSCSEWTGVLLSVLLREAGVQKGARWVVAEGACATKTWKDIPLEKAMDDVLVAYGQNGEAVRPENGYPLRLVNPGWIGVSNVKWLRRIKVVDQPYMGRYGTVQYTTVRPDGKSRWFVFELGPKSVITFPSGGHRLPGRGFYEITGLAWSGGGAVRRVEVSTDGGRTYKDAQLQEPVLRRAHTRFRFAWNWDGGEAVLQSRSTDELGQVQPTAAEVAKIWGGNPDYFQTTTNNYSPFNAIQPWKVNRDGSVQNAISPNLSLPATDQG